MLGSVRSLWQPPSLMNTRDARLVARLRKACAGERAAALAYRGHARTLHRADEIEGIHRIEREEWAHRARVRGMLAELSAAPSRSRERVFHRIGRVLAALCPWSGWTLPMAVAGGLECMNIGEYRAAARSALAAGRPAMAEELGHMADVEREHAQWFGRVLRSRWSPARTERSLAAPPEPGPAPSRFPGRT